MAARRPARAALRAKIEEWIPIIQAAQGKDGYIHSFHTLKKHARFTAIGDHEFYVMGYLMEMGIAHYRMTGGKDRRLYGVATRCADLLCETFGPDPKRTWKNGHPGMEYALCRLGVLVNDAEGPGKGGKYIALAKHFLDHQHEIQPSIYNQSEKPAIQMTEAAGHAVRATYFYTAMTDVALLKGDAAYAAAVDRIWANAIHKKPYITGGVGAAHQGEAFAGDYEVPNNGYCESCAGCGLTFWANGMHRLHAHAHYCDVQERVLYNNLLGAVAQGGTNFYYQNPLVSRLPRYPWHGCPCCVGNIPRALIAIKDLMYSINAKRDTLPASTKAWEGYRVDVTGIRCYSSKDLAHWKDEGLVLKAVTGDPTHELHPSKVCERPKVVFTSRTKQFVMWMHIDSEDYKSARAGVAGADRPTGPFTYIESVRPEGQDSRDQTVFQDDGGKAYRIYSSENNNTTYVSLLTDDYLKHSGKFVRVFIGRRMEAQTDFKHAGKYWFVASDCTGWTPNAAPTPSRLSADKPRSYFR